MYKLKKNFLCAGILEHFFSVIFGHTLNVILGFISRIYTKHSSSLDTRVKPEYDNRKNFIKGLDVVRQCITHLDRRVPSGTRVRKAQAVTHNIQARLDEA